MTPPEEVSFPSISNTQQNLFLTVDKLNEVIRYLQEKHQETTGECLHKNSYSLNRGNLWRCKDCKKVFKQES